MNLFKRCPCPPDAKCSHPWWFEFRHDGRRYRSSTQHTNKTKAERVAQKRYEDAVDGRFEVKIKAASPTFTEFLPDYLEWAKNDHPATAERKDTRVLGTLRDVVGDKALDKITPFDIERWRSVRARKVSRSTVNRELNIVRGFFTKALEWRRLAASPVSGIERYRTDDVRIRVLTEEEIAQIKEDAAPDLALICRVTLESLARLSEVLGLRKEHIGPRWVEIRRKGGRVDRVPITLELRNVLLARADNKTGWVFGPQPPTQEAASLAFTRLFRRLKLPGVSHHTCRHTGVTLMLEAGVSPRAIQKMAGWTSLRMLERYGHARDAEMQRAAATMAAIVAGAQKRPHDEADAPAEVPATS
jgi:integrase